MSRFPAYCSNISCGDFPLPDNAFTLYFPEQPASLEAIGQVEYRCPMCGVVDIEQISVEDLDRLAGNNSNVFDFKEFREGLEPDMFNTSE
jgi:hypothetical protein